MLIKFRAPQLPNQREQYGTRNLQGVFEKGAQKANRGELQRKPQPVVITTLGIDQRLIAVIRWKYRVS